MKHNNLMMYQNSTQQTWAVGDIVLFYSDKKPYPFPCEILEFKSNFSKGETISSKNMNELMHLGLCNEESEFIILRNQNNENIIINLSVFFEKGNYLLYVNHILDQTDYNFQQQCENYLIVKAKTDAEAAFQLGMWNFIGLIKRQNLSEAQKLWENASTKGHALAQCYLAEMFFAEATDDVGKKRYIELLESSANGGCATAQYSLGYYYSTIDSLDLKKAILWYEKGAEQNHAQSQCNLADKYEHGIGVDQNYGKAIHLYKMSAEQNIPEAMYALANMILNEKDLVKDLKLAKAYLSKAGELGYEPAQILLDQLCK